MSLVGGIKWDKVSMERNEKEDSVKLQVDFGGKSAVYCVQNTVYLWLWAHNVYAVSSLTYFNVFTFSGFFISFYNVYINI
jgi:hypothetical protein